MATTPSDAQMLDIISRSSGYGPLSTSYANLLSGFNHRSLGSPVPLNTEGMGIVFFTRPNLNLSYDNLAADRMLTPLLTDSVLTYQRVIRAMLDPVGSGVNMPGNVARNITSPLFDEKQAFMPLLTNNLLSLNGWQDIVLDTYTSKEGVVRENWSMVDGISKINNTFDLTGSFRNIGGDPITLLFAVWATYIDHVHRGVMVPYMKSIIENRIDSHTRIFRFTLDPSRTRIQKWFSTTGVSPIGVPLGAAANFSTDAPYAHENAEEISIQFRCQGSEYLDPLILYEFNETVSMFNPDMADDQRALVYQKIPFQYLRLFNYKGYPHINVATNELEWWVDQAEYQSGTNDHAMLTTRSTYTPSIASAAHVVPPSSPTA